MKQVVIIGADFAPSSLPPATRIRFFVSHLREFGWEPIVLTTKPEYYDWPVDSENEQLLPKSLEVIRTNALRPSWTRKLGVGDIGIRSLRQTWRALKNLCQTRKIDLIFIPVPPYVSMMLGRLAQEKFGIPYVIDYIDPWVTEYYWKLPRAQRPPKWPLAYAMSRLCEPYAIKRVSHITGVSRGTTDSVLSRYERLTETDATEIPYGAEADDFEYLRRQPRVNPIFDRDDGLLHLSCVGACIPSMYATVRALFAAVRLGLDRAPELFGRLRLHFVGTSYASNGSAPHDVLTLASEAGVEAYVSQQAARVPYLDSLQVMLDSSGLFLVGSDEPHYTASKIFPYLLARRPLLAIFHEQSSVVSVLKETGAGQVVSFSEQSPVSDKAMEISQQLESMLGATTAAPANRDVTESYSTRHMTARLARVFDSVLAASGSTQGAAA
jgi:hypothetical protein